MSEGQYIRIEVAYALPEKQWLLTLNVPADSTLAEAVERSHIQDKVPGGLPEGVRFGIWNKLSSESATLQDGDRIEIYRPLQADPKAARKARAKAPPEQAA